MFIYIYINMCLCIYTYIHVAKDPRALAELQRRVSLWVLHPACPLSRAKPRPCYANICIYVDICIFVYA